MLQSPMPTGNRVKIVRRRSEYCIQRLSRSFYSIVLKLGSGDGVRLESNSMERFSLTVTFFC